MDRARLARTALVCLLLLAPHMVFATISTEAPDVVFTDRIQQKAQELGGSPARIYAFVRNELEYQNYYGLMKGPEGTLVSGGGNDYDLAALLVSLLRYSGFDARFVRGVIEVPAADAKAWLGVDSANAAHIYIDHQQPEAWDDTPLETTLTGQGVRLHHVWVEARIPMASYRGAGFGDTRGLAWVPLDPSFKLSDWPTEPGIPFGDAEHDLDLNFDAPDGLYKKVHAKDPLELYEDKVRKYLTTIAQPGKPPASVEDVLLLGQIRAERTGIVPNGLPYRVLQPPGFSLAPRRADSLVALHQSASGWPGTQGALDYRWKRSLYVCSQGSTCDAASSHMLEHVDWSAAWEGKRVLVSFRPVGTPPNSGYANCLYNNGTPISVTPTLTVDGVVTDTYSSMTLCSGTTRSSLKFHAVEEQPLLGSGDPEKTATSDHTEMVGGIYLVGFDSNTASPARTADAAKALVDALAPYQFGTDDGKTYIDSNGDGSRNNGELFLGQNVVAQEALIGGLLHLANAWYYEKDRAATLRAYALFQERPFFYPSAGMVSSGVTVGHAYEIPFAVIPSRLLVDIKGHIVQSMGRDGVFAPCCTGGVLELSAHVSSNLESSVWEELSGVEAISTVKGFQVLSEGDGFHRQILRTTPEDLADLEDFLTRQCNVNQEGPCDPTLIDFEGYCILKKSFAPAQAWHAPAWDSLPGCTEYASSTSRRTFELRAARRARMNYRGWVGSVYNTVTGAPGSTSPDRMSYTIDPSAAGGGYALDYPVAPLSADFSFLNDPFDIPLYDFDIDSWLYNIPSHQQNVAGDPVSVLNGNFYTIETDLEIPGRGGMNLRMVRSYNSRLDYDGPLGHGWVHTYDQHLRNDGSKVVWVTEAGAEIPFNNPSGSPATLTSEPWNHDSLARNADNSYTLATKEGIVYQFLPVLGNKARLSSIRDRNGNTITCTYTTGTNPVLDFVTDTAGRKLNFTYDAARHVTSIDDDDWFGGSGGRRWLYKVDTNGDLIEYTDPVQAALGAAGQSWHYTYYNGSDNDPLNHNLRCWIKPEKRSDDVTTQPCGDDYAKGRSWMLFTYYSNDAVYQHTDALGHTTTFSYNFIRKRTDVVHPDGATETTFYDGYGNIVRFENALGAVREFDFYESNVADAAKRERIKEKDEFGFETRATYDGGNLKTRTDRLNHTESWTYNGFGQPTSHRDRRGNLREWRYDARGNLTAELAELDNQLMLLKEYRYDSFGNRTETIAHNDATGDVPPARTRFDFAPNGVGVIRAVDAFGKIVRFKLDELGRTTHIEKDRSVLIDGKKVLRPTGVDFAYDELNREVAITNPGPLVSEVEYDANGLVSERRQRIPGVADSTRTPVTNEYDAMDRVLETSNALGEPTSFAYDSRDRVVRIATPLGSGTTREYDLGGNRIRETDPSGAETRWVYDAAGRVTAVIDPLGRRLVAEYDREGRIKKRSQLSLGGAERILERFDYDEEGNAVHVFDGAGHQFTQAFDELGRKISVTGPPVTNRFSVTESPVGEMKYDLGGRLISRTDPENNTQSTRYDMVGRMIETTDALGRKRFFEYDELSNLVARVDPLGETVHFHHDDRGLLLRRYADDGSVDDKYSYDGFGRMIVARNDQAAIRMAYDALDRMVAVTDPEAGTAHYLYDADGRLVQHVYPDGPLGFSQGSSTHYQYDARGLVSSIFDSAAGTWRFEYDALGRSVRRTDPSGIEETTRYTPEGFLDQIDVRSGGALVQSTAYSDYDALGNPALIARNTGGGPVVTTLQYDALSRLKVAIYGGSEVEEFDYDLASNRTFHRNRAGAQLVYHVDGGDQLTSITDGSSGQTLQSFEYDAAGRMVALHNGPIGPEPNERFAYDALDRLTAYARSTPGYAMSLEYDASGNRRLRWDTAGFHRYFLGGLERHNATRVRRIPCGDAEPIAEIQESTALGLFRDGGQNVTAVSSGGTVALRRSYDAFGTLQSTTGSAPVERGFAGLQAEGQSPLLYANARHYDPRFGRFLQRDPMGIDTDQLYAYAANNPYRFHDPTGLSPMGISDYDPSSQGGFGFLDAVQAGLDVASIGLDATGVGAAVSFVPDLLNAGISLGRGDFSGAGLSAVAAVPFIGAAANSARLLRAGNDVANAGGFIRSFVTSQDQTFFRVFSGDATAGRFLTAVPPRSSAFAREALALPPGNKAEFIQEVLVPAGTRLQRSRALSAFGRRGGAEQFELIDRIPVGNFGAGVPLP